jgi:hypothetical protein
MFALRATVVCALWSAAWIRADGNTTPLKPRWIVWLFGAAYAVSLGMFGAIGIGILLLFALVLYRARLKSWEADRSALFMFMAWILTLLWFTVAESLLARVVSSL